MFRKTTFLYAWTMGFFVGKQLVFLLRSFVGCDMERSSSEEPRGEKKVDLYRRTPPHEVLLTSLESRALLRLQRGTLTMHYRAPEAVSRPKTLGGGGKVCVPRVYTSFRCLCFFRFFSTSQSVYVVPLFYPVRCLCSGIEERIWQGHWQCWTPTGRKNGLM